MRISSRGSIEGRPRAVVRRQVLADTGKVNEAVDGPEQVIRWHVPFQTEAIEQLLPHHTLLAHHRLNLFPIRRLNQCFRTVSSLTFSTLSTRIILLLDQENAGLRRVLPSWRASSKSEKMTVLDPMQTALDLGDLNDIPVAANDDVAPAADTTTPARRSPGRNRPMSLFRSTPGVCHSIVRPRGRPPAAS